MMLLQDSNLVVKFHQFYSPLEALLAQIVLNSVCQIPFFTTGHYILTFMKIFNYLFVLIFILFAAVQYNDPDPYLWIPIYIYPAVLCYLAARNQFHKQAYIGGFIFFTIYALYKLLDQNGIVDWINYHDATNIAATMKAEQPWIEESREFFGLVIILAVLFINYRKFVKSNTVSKG